MGINRELRGLVTGTSNTGTRNWIQVLVTFHPPIRYINSIKYQQEMVEDDDKVIIGWEHVFGGRIMNVWSCVVV